MAGQVALLQRTVKTLQDDASNAPSLPDWPPLAGHHFSPEMIAMCCRLCLLIGFRAVPKVLECINETFGLSLNIPTRDAVRNWSSRNGVAILQQAETAEDWIWMIDHSVQLGKMSVLVVLGIRRADLPDDRPLRRHDMTPLGILPSDSRNKAEVARQLREVADRTGMPLAVVCDGACELHEGVGSLETAGFQGVCIDDIKHKVSNLLKRTLVRDTRFAAFEKKLGHTTAAIQQTELEHLLPPRKKTKCRFMSFDRLIDWATMIEQQLENPTAPARLSEKLGWLREFRTDIAGWREARELIGRVLSTTNTQGVFCGATAALADALGELPATSATARQLREAMLAFSQANEDKLLSLGPATPRLPCSTEVLESAFGSFKAIGRNHNRGSFTTLLAVFPTLFAHCTAEAIRPRFALVSNRDLQHWLRAAGLTNSTQSRRTQAYQQTHISS